MNYEKHFYNENLIENPGTMHCSSQDYLLATSRFYAPRMLPSPLGLRFTVGSLPLRLAKCLASLGCSLALHLRALVVAHTILHFFENISDTICSMKHTCWEHYLKAK